MSRYFVIPEPGPKLISYDILDLKPSHPISRLGKTLRGLFETKDDNIVEKVATLLVLFYTCQRNFWGLEGIAYKHDANFRHFVRDPAWSQRPPSTHFGELLLRYVETHKVSKDYLKPYWRTLAYEISKNQANPFWKDNDQIERFGKVESVLGIDESLLNRFDQLVWDLKEQVTDPVEDIMINCVFKRVAISEKVSVACRLRLMAFSFGLSRAESRAWRHAVTTMNDETMKRLREQTRNWTTNFNEIVEDPWARTCHLLTIWGDLTSLTGEVRFADNYIRNHADESLRNRTRLLLRDPIKRLIKDTLSNLDKFEAQERFRKRVNTIFDNARAAAEKRLKKKRS